MVFLLEYAQNNTNVTQLNQAYEELKNLNNQKPHPGSGNVDNIKNAKEQQQQLKAWIDTARKHFQRIPPIPDLPKLSDRDFSQALERNPGAIASRFYGGQCQLASGLFLLISSTTQQSYLYSGHARPTLDCVGRGQGNRTGALCSQGQFAGLLEA